jgi:hypothetical protein
VVNIGNSLQAKRTYHFDIGDDVIWIERYLVIGGSLHNQMDKINEWIKSNG